MREIRCRGKSLQDYHTSIIDGIEKGNWVEGYYCHSSFCNSAVIITDLSECGGMGQVEIMVDPVTVGQFTGLHDSTKWEELTKQEGDEWLKTSHKVPNEWKGKEVFEGDVLNHEQYGGPFEVVFMKNMFWHGINMHEDDEKMGEFCLIAFNFKDAKIIGNITDNPELLK